MSSLDALRTAFKRFEKSLFPDIWRAQDEPDETGTRWLELYRGSPVDKTFVCVDFNCNVLHAELVGRELLTITYIPGWFYEIVTRTLSFGLREDYSVAYVQDLDRAQPLVLELFVEHETADVGGSIDVTLAGDSGSGFVFYSRLAFGYEFEPCHAFAVEADRTGTPWNMATPWDGHSASVIERIHWGPMKLRLVAGPGVRFTRSPLINDTVLGDARRAYEAHEEEPVSCDQALQFELERRQDPHTLPGLAVPYRPAPLAEIDLVAGSVKSRRGAALALEQTRPDGVDIMLVRPGPARSVAPWLVELPMQLARDTVETLVAWLGGIPPSAPLPIRIRVELESAGQRFAYRIRYLNSFREPSSEPTDDIDPAGPFIRLDVIRTAGVSVFLDTALATWGEDELDRMVDFYEEVVDFDSVPILLDDEHEAVRRTKLPDRPATIEEVLTLAYQVGEFVPLPMVQVMYDLRDAGSLGTYLLHGRDVVGEEMTALDAAITLGGLVLPEVGERAAKGLARGVRRLRTVGDDPFARLVSASDGLTSEDALLVAELHARALTQ